MSDAEKKGLSPEAKKAVVDGLLRCLESDDVRIVLRAASKLIALERQNQIDEHRRSDEIRRQAG